jgi:hypothetical protein
MLCGSSRSFVSQIGGSLDHLENQSIWRNQNSTRRVKCSALTSDAETKICFMTANLTESNAIPKDIFAIND